MTTKSDTFLNTNMEQQSNSEGLDQFSTAGKTGGAIIKKNVNLLSAIMVVIGTMVGSGIFMTPNSIVNVVPSFILSLVIWVICGIVIFVGMMCYAELGLLYPRCGGEFVYLEHAYHPCVSYSFLVTSYLLIKPVQTAMLLFFFVETLLRVSYFDAVEIPYWSTRLLTSLMMVIMCILNCYSTKISLEINNILTYCKTICMLIIFGLGIYHLAIGNIEHLLAAKNIGNISASGISIAIYAGMWAYEGWNEFGYMMEEMEHPEKYLVKGLLISITSVTVSYFLVNFSYLVILGVDGVSLSSSVAIDATEIYFGKWSAIIAVFISLSALGSANATFFCGGRIYFDGARKGHFPEIICALHKKYNTMMVSYVTQSFLTMLYALFAKDIETLLIYFSNAMWVYYGLTIFGIIVIRYRVKPKNQKFKVPLVVPVIMSLIAFALVILSFVDSPIETSISLAILVGAVPLYFIFVQYKAFIPLKMKRIYGNFEKIALQTFNLELAELRN